VQHPDSMRRAFLHSSQKLVATIVERVFVIPPLKWSQTDIGWKRWRLPSGETTCRIWKVRATCIWLLIWC